jgi:hypothetical protein
VFDRTYALAAGQAWVEWQRDVVAILRRDFREALDHISLDEVDWAAWLRFYARAEARALPSIVRSSAISDTRNYSVTGM